MAKKLALIIGIENYSKTSGLARVLYAKNDVLAIADYAKQAGFRLMKNKPLLDKDATYSEVISQLDSMFYYAAPEDFILLYFVIYQL